MGVHMNYNIKKKKITKGIWIYVCVFGIYVWETLKRGYKVEKKSAPDNNQPIEFG